MTDKQLENFFKNDEMYVAFAYVSFIVVDLYFLAYVKCKSIAGRNFDPICAYFHKGLFHQINSVRQMVEISKLNYEKYKKDPKFIDNKIKDHIKASDRVEEAWDLYQSKKNLSDNELLRIYKKISSLYTNYVKFDALGEDKGRFIEESILPKLRSSLNNKLPNVNEAINILAHPNEQAIFNLEKVDFLDICLKILADKKLKLAVKENNLKKIKENKIIVNLIERYINKYFWKETDFFRAKKLSFSSVIKEVRKYIEENNIVAIKNEYKFFKNGHKNLLKQKAGINNKIKLSANDKRDIEFISKISAWIDLRKYLMMKNLYYMFTITGEMLKRRSITWKIGNYLMYDEIIDIYTGKKKLNRGIVEKRKKSDFIVIYSVNKETRIIYGSKATKLFNVAKGESDSEIIKGMVASQGKKKKLLGKVRVVRDPYKAKFKTGEILVASMTRIEFVPLMRKAAGIITNEGGIASHAAVVSREFGLPCIIGTRYATDKLKNGDKIEMDMEEGTIKVIN